MNKPVTIIISLILIAIALFLFTIPEYRQYQSLRLTVMEKQAQYSGESIYFARISDILSGLQNRQEALGKIQSALPDGFSLGPLVDFLHKKGSENGVLVTSVVFAETPVIFGAEQAQDVLFSVDAKGGYEGLKNFLLAMDNSARLLEMDSVVFSKIPTVPGVRVARNQPQEYALKLEVRTRSY